MTTPFTLVLDTKAGPHQYGFHLGTDDGVARLIAESIFRRFRVDLVPSRASRVPPLPEGASRVTRALLMRDGAVVATFDGSRWSDARVARPSA